MVEKATDKNIAEIRKLLKAKKIIIGTERTLKQLKLGNLKKIYLSPNCPDKVKASLVHYSKLGEVEILNLKYSSDELGILCKKPFAISVLSVPK